MLFDSICKIDASVRRSDAGGGSGGRNRDRTAMPAERSTQRGTIFAVYDGCLCFTDSRIPEAEGPDGVSRG